MTVYAAYPLSWYSRAIREIENTVIRQRRTNSSPVIARERLARLHKTLDRLETGTFGKCSSCEQAIEVDRLEQDIATTLCATCARLRTV